MVLTFLIFLAFFGAGQAQVYRLSKWQIFCLYSILERFILSESVSEDANMFSPTNLIMLDRILHHTIQKDMRSYYRWKVVRSYQSWRIFLEDSLKLWILEDSSKLRI